MRVPTRTGVEPALRNTSFLERNDAVLDRSAGYFVGQNHLSERLLPSPRRMHPAPLSLLRSNRGER
jgi:hypothetical protein